MGETDDRAARGRKAARDAFLREDGRYGCAEATFLALKQAWGLDNPDDTAVAMALNGGIAYSGGICGAISGAGLALGLLASRRIEDHRTAKRVSRSLLAEVLADFRRQFGAVDCRALTGYNLDQPGEHERFIADGSWRTWCTGQVEYVVARLADLGDQTVWRDRIARFIA